MLSVNSIVNSRAFLSGAPGSIDWATTPHVYHYKDYKLPYLTERPLNCKECKFLVSFWLGKYMHSTRY